METGIGLNNIIMLCLFCKQVFFFNFYMKVWRPVGGRLDTAVGWLVLGITYAYAREHMIVNHWLNTTPTHLCPISEFGIGIWNYNCWFWDLARKFRLSGSHIRIRNRDLGISIIYCFKEFSPKSPPKKNNRNENPKEILKMNLKVPKPDKFRIFWTLRSRSKKYNWIWDSGKIPIESFYSPIFLPWVICGGVLTLDSLLEKSE